MQRSKTKGFTTTVTMILYQRQIKHDDTRERERKVSLRSLLATDLPATPCGKRREGTSVLVD